MNETKKFRTMVALAIIWLIMFLMMLMTKTPTARGATMLISVICVLWFAYWTISMIRSKNGNEPAKKEANAKQKNSTK